MPGFAIGIVEAGALVGLLAEKEAGDAAGGGERKDIPGVLGEDVGGEEVDFGGQVGDGASGEAAVSVDAVHAVEKLRGTFDLHAGERARGRTASFEDEVVAFAVAVWLGDGESEAGSFESEGEFGEFSAALGVEFVGGERVGGVRAPRAVAARTSAIRHKKCAWPLAGALNFTLYIQCNNLGGVNRTWAAELFWR